jgi:hypothetical protein
MNRFVKTEPETEAKQTHVSNSDYEPTIGELIRALSGVIKKLWILKVKLLRFAIAGSMLGYGLSFTISDAYVAEMKLVPYRSGLSGSAGISGLAGLAGIRVPSGMEQTVSVDLYPEVVKSTAFRKKIIETPLRYGADGKTIRLIELFNDSTKNPFVNKTKTTKPNAKSGLPNFKDTPAGRIPTFTTDQYNAMTMLAGSLEVKVDRSTSLITISAEMPDPFLSADLVRVASKTLMERLTEIESRKAREQYSFVSAQYSKKKATYDSAQMILAAFLDRNRILSTALSQVERDRLARERDLAYEVLQQVSRDLEQARLKLSIDTPVFGVIDDVSVPPHRSSPNRIQLAAISAFLSLLLALGSIFFRDITKNIEKDIIDPGLARD